jgi:hypothetical protein
MNWFGKEIWQSPKVWVQPISQFISGVRGGSSPHLMVPRLISKVAFAFDDWETLQAVTVRQVPGDIYSQF